MQMGIKGDGHSGERYPGSRDAIERGCSCDAVQNRYGEGQRSLSGFKLFVPDEECPLHGFKAVFVVPSRAPASRAPYLAAVR
jgi:hypothetical protein